jgi:hypothetical protein
VPTILLATSVVGAIAPQVERAEIERAKRKPTENLNAYDYYLRGIANLHQGTREAISEALSLCDKAIQLDPDFGYRVVPTARRPLPVYPDKRGYSAIGEKRRLKCSTFRHCRRLAVCPAKNPDRETDLA